MGAREAVAPFARRVLGELYGPARMIVLRAEDRFRGVPDRAQFAAEFAGHAGTLVRRGPFTGMHFFERIPGSTSLVPVLLGIYEQELQPAIEQEIARGPGLVVDIGSAEGYYAVGLARRLPGSRVVAFDTDAAARYMCRRLARLNGVSSRVEVCGECDTGYLSTLVPDTLVVSDCEGAEQDLLDPDRAPALKGVTMIVEVHDSVGSDISDALKARFASSHDIEEIQAGARDPSAYPELDSYSASDAARAVSEARPGHMAWLVLRPLGDQETRTRTGIEPV